MMSYSEKPGCFGIAVNKGLKSGQPSHFLGLNSGCLALMSHRHYVIYHIVHNKITYQIHTQTADKYMHSQIWQTETRVRQVQQTITALEVKRPVALSKGAQTKLKHGGGKGKKRMMATSIQSMSCPNHNLLSPQMISTSLGMLLGDTKSITD